VLSRGAHVLAGDAYITQFLEGLLEVVHGAGMRLMIDIVSPEHQKEAYLQLVRAKHIDGMILSGPRFDDAALDALQETGFPTVLNGFIPERAFCAVDVDNCAAAERAVRHLIDLGHQRIACITNAPLHYTAAAERLRGYRQALDAAGIAYDAALVRCGNFDPDSGYQQMANLLAGSPRPTAVFVASDVVAAGAMGAIHAADLRIPGDVALMAFDDVPFARYLQPSLSTVHLPARDLARQACEMLLQLIRRETPAQPQLFLDTTLMIRQSCGATPTA
jgi:LacI family transcriptional regulator